MKTGDKRALPGNPLSASIFGAVIAVIIVYAVSYFLMHFGLGLISVPGKTAQHGPAALMRAGLNMYAMHHAKLVGSGDGMTATVMLPFTAWFLGPALALLIGGNFAAKQRAYYGRLSALSTALASGILYSVILWSLAPIFHAQISASALPAISQCAFNPPEFQFKVDALDAFISTLIFGVIFSYLGALLTLRGDRNEKTPGKWWVCGKAVILTAIAFQLVLAGVFELWMFTNPPKPIVDPTGQRIAEMLPTTIGGAYLLVNGAKLTGSLEARTGLSVERPFSGSASLYRGTIFDESQKGIPKPLPNFVWIVVAVMGLGIMLSGWRAVKAGSIDGSLPTALRITLMHSAYIAFLLWACRISWGYSYAKIPSNMKALIGAIYTPDMLCIVASIFVLSFIGAYSASRRYTGRPGFPMV